MQYMQVFVIPAKAGIQPCPYLRSVNGQIKLTRRMYHWVPIYQLTPKVSQRAMNGSTTE